MTNAGLEEAARGALPSSVVDKAGPATFRPDSIPANDVYVDIKLPSLTHENQNITSSLNSFGFWFSSVSGFFIEVLGTDGRLGKGATLIALTTSPPRCLLKYLRKIPISKYGNEI